MHHGAFTHQSGLALSRLARIYVNQHTVEQLDRDLKTVALAWQHRLSAHRALSFRRRIPERTAIRGVSSTAIRHADFPRRVRLAYGDYLREDPGCDAVSRLQHFKRAMETVSTNLARDPLGIAAAQTTAEKLGAVMKFIRAVERGSIGELSLCLHLYPNISRILPTLMQRMSILLLTSLL